MPFYRDNHVTLYNANCRSMDELPNESVQCCVTSPPYWGLRKYAGNQDNEDWGCAYGLEPTPELYVSHSIEILREIRRVLRKDGVVFWNIGDSYNAAPRYTNQNRGGETDWSAKYNGANDPRLKPKDLCLIPFRVAIAAQEDGWWVRSVIIWSKNNAMPESVKDRPTDAHEYILMLTKSADYYYDIDAVREPQKEVSIARMGRGHEKPYDPGFPAGPHNHFSDYYKKNEGKSVEEIRETVAGRNIRTVWEFSTASYVGSRGVHFASFPEELPERCIKAASKEGDLILDPFSGSGTTLWVAKKLGRRAVGYEISEEYCRLAVDRNRQQVMI